MIFQDEARLGRIHDVRRWRASTPMRPACQAMLSHEYTFAYAAEDRLASEFDALILPHVNTACMPVFLDEMAACHADRRVVLVLDGAGWHAGGERKVPASVRVLPRPP